MLSVNQIDVHQKDVYQKSVINIVVDEHGFLVNPSQWTAAFAENILGLLPGELTPRHLVVMEFVRYKFLHLGALPPVRNVCKCTGIEKTELKMMFGSCLQLWRATGLPRPDDEIRSHMN